MARPKVKRLLKFKPEVYYFKPRGIPLKTLEEVIIFADELEAMKLHDADGLGHIEASEKMGVSQPTFGRILNSAYQKIVHAIIKGKAIKIQVYK